ncbi:histidine kinase [Sideroxydans lithotrophicus]|nr:histidine kinase [Sideroxydans lithotrophicus]
MMKSPYTIRAQLMALVAAVALPMVGILAYTIYDNAKQQIVEAQTIARTLVVASASDVDHVLITNRDLLRQIAKRSLIRKMDGKHCDQVLSDLHDLFPKSANMTLIDIQGTAICSVVPQTKGKQVSVANAAWFKKSLATDGLVVSEPFVGPITGRWVTVLTYPIHDDAGNKIGFLGLPLDLALYEPDLSDAQLVPGTSIGVITAGGAVVWRNIDADKWIGKDLSNNKEFEKILAVKQGAIEGKGFDSIPRFYYVSPIAWADWYVYVGIPTSPFYSQLRKMLVRNILFSLAMLSFVFGVAWLIARRISNPISQLTAVTRAISQGSRVARAELVGPPEIREVAQEFNEMLKIRWHTEAALRESEINLSEALKIARMGHWEYELITDEFVLNDQYYSLHHTSAEKMGGYRMRSAEFSQRLVHPGDAHLIDEYIQRSLSVKAPELHLQAEARIICGDGKTRWVLVRFKIEQDNNGVTTRLLGVNQDITERKHAEQTRQKLNRALVLVSECNALVIHADNEQSLLSDICRLTVESGGFLMAWIGFAEHDANKTVRPVAQTGYEEGYLESVNVTWADTERGQGPTGKAIRTMQTVVNQDCQFNSDMAPWREAAIKRGYQSSIGIPLVINGKAIGALTINSADPFTFSKGEVVLLEDLADNLSYGIQTLRTRNEHQSALTFLQKSELSLEQSNQQLRDLTIRREEAREDERKRIARDLHDELGQILTVLRMDLSVMRMQFGASNPALLDQIKNILSRVDSTIQVVRDVASKLRPGALEAGIVAALEWQVAEFAKRSDIHFDLKIDESNIDLDDERATAIFRIVQESLTNVTRHAAAANVCVSLSRLQDNYILEIIDDGRGFDTEMLSGRTFGLMGVRERSMMLEGTVDIRSSPGKGTHVTVYIPVMKRQKR